MKTILIITAFIIAAALHSLGQGTVRIENDNNTLVYVETSPGSTIPVPAGPQFQAELLFAPDGTPLAVFDGAATRVGVPVNFGPLPGRFSFSGRTISAITPPGGFGLFQVRGFGTLNGTDYAGESIVVRIDTGNPATSPPEAPGTLTGSGFQSFTLTPVPEPSTVGLTALGVGVLLLRRRIPKT